MIVVRFTTGLLLLMLLLLLLLLLLVCFYTKNFFMRERCIKRMMPDHRMGILLYGPILLSPRRRYFTTLLGSKYHSGTNGSPRRKWKAISAAEILNNFYKNVLSLLLWSFNGFKDVSVATNIYELLMVTHDKG